MKATAATPPRMEHSVGANGARSARQGRPAATGRAGRGRRSSEQRRRRGRGHGARDWINQGRTHPIPRTETIQGGRYFVYRPPRTVFQSPTTLIVAACASGGVSPERRRPRASTPHPLRWRRTGESFFDRAEGPLGTVWLPGAAAPGTCLLVCCFATGARGARPNSSCEQERRAVMAACRRVVWRV